MNITGTAVVGLLSASSLLALMQPARAQSTIETPGPLDSQQEQSAQAHGLNDIVVTARKRQESLQDVPVAITAFSGEALREKNIQTSYDVPLHTPGLTVRTASAERNGADFFIRGQGSTFGSGPGVVAYFANVPGFGSLLGNNIQFYDLGSIQVLKGPQGTLFGRSTTGGAILIDPQMPTSKLEGFVEARGGNYSMHELTGALNVPLVNDVLMLRVAGNYLRRDGFTTSSTTGQRLDDRHRESYRIGLLFRPADTFESYTLFYGEHIDENASGSVLLAFNPNIPQFNTGPAGAGRAGVTQICGLISAPAQVAGCIANRIGRIDVLRNQLAAEAARVRAGGSVRKTPTAYEDLLRGHAQVIQNTTTVSPGTVPLLGDLTIKNIFATHRTLGAASTREIGGAAFPHAQPINGQELVGGIPTITGRSGSTKFFDRFTEEFQVGGATENVDWLIGYYVEVNDRDFSTPPIFPNFNNAFTIPLDQLTYQGQLVLDQHDVDRGLFGQATVRFDRWIPGLSATAGYRKSKSKRRSVNAPAIVTPGGVGIGPRTPGSSLDEKVSSYNFSFDYQATPDLLLYATTRKGYKPGGVNAPAATTIPGVLLVFKPEILKDVELGVKLNWDSGSLQGRSNLALYKQWYSDIQRNEILVNPNPPYSTVTQVNNIAAASVKGLELENVLQIDDRWTLTLNYAYTDAGYTEYPGSTVNVLGVSTPNVEAPYVGTPKHQATFGARYEAITDSDIGNVALSGDFYIQSDVELDDQALQNPERVGHQKSWTNLNLRLEWNKVMGSTIDLAAFVRNVTDDTHLLGVGSLINNLGVITGIYNEPRTAGLELRYRFGQ